MGQARISFVWRSILVGALLLFFYLDGTSAPWASVDTNTLQAHLNEMGKMGKLRKKMTKDLTKDLNEINNNADLTPEEKRAQMERRFESTKRQAEELQKIGDDQQRADWQLYLDTLRSFKHFYLEESGDLPLPAGVAAEKARLDEEERRKAEREGGEGKKVSDSGFSVEGTANIGYANLPSQGYLAVEPIPGVLNYHPVHADNDVTLTGFDVGFEWKGEYTGYAFGPETQDTVITGFFSYRNGEASDHLGRFDPHGAGLGLPGAGTPGFFLASFGGFNVIENLKSTIDYSSYGGNLGMRHAMFTGGILTISPLIAGSIIRYNQDSTFSGAIPGYGVDFEYVTEIDFTRYGLTLGARAEAEIMSGLSFYLEPSASLYYVNVDGTDTFKFISAQQTVHDDADLDEGETDIGVSAMAGLDFEPEALPFEIYVGGRIDYSPAAVTVFRSGETGDQSEAEVKYVTSYTGWVTVKVPLSR